MFLNKMLKRKTIICTALILVFAVLFSSCGREKNYPDGKTVAIAMPTKSIERFERDGAYLKKQFEDAGYNVEIRYSNDDSYQQNNDIECMIADNVDILIVCAVDGMTLSQTLKTAAGCGIPVIAYDRLIMNTDAVKCYVSFDNYAVGQLQGQYVIDALGLDNNDETFNIEICAGDPADNNAVYFFRGAYDVLLPYIESGRLKVPSGRLSFEQCATDGWSVELANRNMQNVLASYYSAGERLDAVVCSSDNISLGVSYAIRSDYAGSNMPVITGQDGNIANIINIVDGSQSMTVFKNVNDEASAAIAITKAMLSGKSIDEGLLSLFSFDVSFDDTSYNNGRMNIDSFLLKPCVITRDNLDELTQTGLYKWDEQHRYLEIADTN